MTDMEGKTRHQGIDEHPAQQRDARTPILRPEEVAILKEAEKKETLDRILQNKNLYYQKEDQDAIEDKMRPQIGYPQMREKEATQEEIQANQHQDQVFAGVKATERFRMGHMQEELEKARTQKGFEPNVKATDQLVLEAGNNPTPGKEQNLNKELTAQENEWKRVFYSNIPFKEKIAFFKNAIRAGKIPGMKDKLNETKQIKRGKRLMKELDSQSREKLRKLKNNHNVVIRQMGRCA